MAGHWLGVVGVMVMVGNIPSISGTAIGRNSVSHTTQWGEWHPWVMCTGKYCGPGKRSRIRKKFQTPDISLDSGVFTLRLLTMNVWGGYAEDIEARISAIASFLRQSQHDIVFIQEAWYQAEFKVLRDTFPYSTFYSTPGSVLCPSVKHDQSFYLQLFPVDCHGLMILSKHRILNEEYVFFKDRIPETIEYFGRRGALAATIEVTKAVAGVSQSMNITAITTHLATWYGEAESLWSNVREKQADDVIAMVAAHKDESDLVVIAGDLNSTPKSPVFNKFLSAGLVDTLLDLEGEDKDAASTITWGHTNNTWTAGEPGARLDYVLFTHASDTEIRTSAYHTVGARTIKEGKEISLSDHMWVEADLMVSEAV